VQFRYGTKLQVASEREREGKGKGKRKGIACVMFTRRASRFVSCRWIETSH